MIKMIYFKFSDLWKPSLETQESMFLTLSLIH